MDGFRKEKRLELAMVQPCKNSVSVATMVSRWSMLLH